MRVVMYNLLDMGMYASSVGITGHEFSLSASEVIMQMNSE